MNYAAQAEKLSCCPLIASRCSLRTTGQFFAHCLFLRRNLFPRCSIELSRCFSEKRSEERAAGGSVVLRSNRRSRHEVSAPQSGRRDPTNERDLRRVVRRPIAPEDVVKPHRRIGRVLPIPGVPRIDRLRLARGEAPVEGAHTPPSENRQDLLEGAAPRASHELGADDRPTVALESRDESLHIRAVVVAVERDD